MRKCIWTSLPCGTVSNTMTHRQDAFKSELDPSVQLGILEETGRSEWIVRTFVISKKDNRARGGLGLWWIEQDIETRTHCTFEAASWLPSVGSPKLVWEAQCAAIFKQTKPAASMDVILPCPENNHFFDLETNSLGDWAGQSRVSANAKLACDPHVSVTNTSSCVQINKSLGWPLHIGMAIGALFSCIVGFWSRTERFLCLVCPGQHNASIKQNTEMVMIRFCFVVTFWIAVCSLAIWRLPASVAVILKWLVTQKQMVQFQMPNHLIGRIGWLLLRMLPMSVKDRHQKNTTFFKEFSPTVVTRWEHGGDFTLHCWCFLYGSCHARTSLKWCQNDSYCTVDYMYSRNRASFMSAHVYQSGPSQIIGNNQSCPASDPMFTGSPTAAAEWPKKS